MRIKTLSCLVLAGMLSLSSCVEGDINDLQNQIDDLTSKVENLELSQQEALLAAIASLEADLAALNSELVGDLELLQEEVESNANAVYYGNVITDADYIALAEQGATIITGRVVVASDANIQALANVKLVGKNLEIMVGGTITMDALQSIGESLIVADVNIDASLSFAKLSSVGGNFEVMNNSGLTSVVADELVLISGGLSSVRNLDLTTFSLAKLDKVGEIYIDEQVPDDFDNPAGELAMLDLSSTNVANDVEIHYLGAVENLTLGSIGGDFECEFSEVAKISIDGVSIDGDFVLDNNKFLAALDVANLSRIEGKLTISNNFDWNTPGSGLTTLPSFDALTFIGGDVSISNNSNLISAESFNNVTEVRGATIDFSSNGNLDIINIFNALVETANPASSWGDNSHANITIYANTFWFNGFGSLVNAQNVNVSVAKTAGVFNEETGGFEPGGDTAKFDGFGSLVEVSTLTITASEVTEFNAFSALNNFNNFATYFTLYMPSDVNVGLCSMSPILTRIKNGDFDSSWNANKKAVFNYNWSEQDRDAAIEQLLTSCNL